jgi:DNA adenine methylase
MSGPIKWHGGKCYLAKRIVALMPPHLHYVEPYFGGGAVLLAKDPEGVSEVVNDLNKDLTDFWRVLQSLTWFPHFQRHVEAVPFSEVEYDDADLMLACDAPAPEWLRAARFFIACRQSLAGRMNGFTGITKTRVRRGMNNEVSAWLSAVEGLPLVHARLNRVLILNRPALEVIRSQDGPQTLFYADPPYLHETRATTGEYAHEMTEKDHADLLAELRSIKGKFLLSGYRSPLYDTFAANHGWRRVDFDLPNQAAGGKEKRRMVESVWMNYPGDA